MFFELFNIPTSFQGYINKILAKKLDIFIIVYLNDIFIYIKDPSQSQVEAVRWLLNILKRYRQFTNLKSVNFIKTKFVF